MSSPDPAPAPAPDPSPDPEPARPPRPAGGRSVLPDQTSDDLDVGWGERVAETSDDERFLRDRPPHW